MNIIIRLSVTSLALVFVACATPCKTLKSAIDIGTLGQPLVHDICACMVVDPSAQSVCLTVAAGYDFGLAQGQAAYAKFCSQDAGAKASIVDTSPAGFAASFEAIGAVKR